ncbi:MAG: DsrE/DsrF/TusD sulfur relay family protein [Methanotrichaceae archaeon]
MQVLLLFNRNPYDGTDVTWNGLRLADQLLALGLDVHIFLMNDSVDLARDVCKPPEGYFDLGQMLKDLIAKSVLVKVCGTCKVRCGIHKGKPYFEGAQEAKMTELAEWVKDADRILSF